MVEDLIKELRQVEKRAIEIEEEGKQRVKEIFKDLEEKLNQSKEADQTEINENSSKLENDIIKEIENYSLQLKTKETQLSLDFINQKNSNQKIVNNYIASLFLHQVENGHS